MKNKKLTSSFKVGAIALAFLVIGYQGALFIRGAAVTRLISHRDSPDTVYVIDEALAERLLDSGQQASEAHAAVQRQASGVVVRKDAQHSAPAREIALSNRSRRVESFRFDPNTVSVEDLQRLGFSEKQALSIDSYRRKGGRFRRPSDFARSYIVADSVFDRLEPFIDIPKIDINAADSATFDTLPGIGAYFAAKMVSYRDQLGGYSFAEQLLDIYRFDEEKFAGLKDPVTVGAHEPYPLWTLPEEKLREHPYIGSYSAHGIVVYRQNNPVAALTPQGLVAAGIIRPEVAEKFERCSFAPPPGVAPAE